MTFSEIMDRVAQGFEGLGAAVLAQSAAGSTDG